MKIRTLQSIANSICQMGCSARVNSSLELLADLPDDVVEIDLLAGSCRHPKMGFVDIPLMRDFGEWLGVQLDKMGIPLGLLQQVLISLRYKTDRVPTDRSRVLLFDLECNSKIVIRDRVFDGYASDAIWYSRESTWTH